LEAALFWHEERIFTGAVAQRIRRIELASCGTISLRLSLILQCGRKT
jgi:transcriptional regulator with GAF, ATPase, and Fis domain